MGELSRANSARDARFGEGSAGHGSQGSRKVANSLSDCIRHLIARGIGEADVEHGAIDGQLEVSRRARVVMVVLVVVLCHFHRVVHGIHDV